MDKDDLISTGVIVIVALVVFAAAFILSRPPTGPHTYNVSGIAIVSDGNPQDTMSAILANHSVVMWIEAPNKTAVIPCSQVAASEMAIAVGHVSRTLTVQGRITSGYCVGKDNNETACLPPQIIVRSSTADNVVVDSKAGSIIVEGDDKWLCNSAPTLRNMIAWVLSK